jgi:peptide-methionine (S)-S-oxide reductase
MMRCVLSLLTVSMPLLMPGAAAAQADGGTESAIFAGGCFWCMEPPFDALDGVISTTSGYTGGELVDPTYEQVSSGGTGHVEAVEVVYDPEIVSYEMLLDVFWRNIDPVDDGGQFCDRGPQYRSSIFVRNERQRLTAEASRTKVARSGELSGEIATAIRPARAFYPAEAYHQDYYRENPLRYKFYRFTCGRDQRLSELWGDDRNG